MASVDKGFVLGSAIACSEGANLPDSTAAPAEATAGARVGCEAEFCEAAAGPKGATYEASWNAFVSYLSGFVSEELCGEACLDSGSRGLSSLKLEGQGAGKLMISMIASQVEKRRGL